MVFRIPHFLVGPGKHNTYILFNSAEPRDGYLLLFASDCVFLLLGNSVLCVYCVSARNRKGTQTTTAACNIIM